MVERTTETLPKTEAKFPWRIIALASPLVLMGVILLPNLGPVFRTFTVPSASMAPSLPAGSVLIASRLSYGYSRYSFDAFNLPISGRWPAGSPKPGDVIVFRLTRNPKVLYIKRVIGMPGDRIAYRAGRVELNGKPLDLTPGTARPRNTTRSAVPAAPFIERLPDGTTYPVLLGDGSGRFATMPEVAVPPGHLYVLGDNRPNSTDSRHARSVGFVPIDHVVGKVITSWRP